ncbi:MAG: SIS domain-containing protein [Rhodospirillales bacterium]|nr:SIS domain-containing protein [Rhodospirillales bacterium]
MIAEIVRYAAVLPLDRLNGLVDSVSSADRVFVHAVGRCGMVVGMFATRLAHLEIPCFVVGERTTPAAGHGDLLVSASGSGDTSSTVLIAERARAAGTRVLGLTAHPEARIARHVDEMIVLPVPAKTDHPDAKRSVQPPGSLFEQLLLCFLDEAVLRLARQRDANFEMIQRRHANLE